MVAVVVVVVVAVAVVVKPSHRTEIKTMPLKNLKDFTDLLIPLQEAYGQLETEYELQRAALHEKAKENSKLREALEEIAGECLFASEAKEIARKAISKTPHSQ